MEGLLSTGPTQSSFCKQGQFNFFFCKNTDVVTYLSQWLNLFLQMGLQRCHAQTVIDSSSNNIIDYVAQV